ncbi:uncharacterized protein LOC106882646 [Octopus bimaculoides]|uniref:GPR158/179 extracellular domain-containing protein n=1 Tax=Octopus bimaculoides TaxID=37653 RepID=A0A0L8I8P2_OCTBM|nr:uncharacterized protein LOC106882646 [Octopus bimaculoides]|eukprot:XP_014788876.1 PREDICTED: uncharacterized protein LOC106882646 [Octopus bimaculoides]
MAKTLISTVSFHLACLFVVFLYTTYTSGEFEWMKYDHYDEIQDKITAVTPQNCRGKSRDQLTVRADVVSQLPKYNELLSKIMYKNRTKLLHLHNMALNRAYFYSYMLQKFNESKNDFPNLPGWMYMYMSAVADVNANPFSLNGSSLFYDYNCSYPNWLDPYKFNTTLPLFGPSAWRWDDSRDSDNYLREMTLQTVMIKDFGASNHNYTDPSSKTTPWYNVYKLPDTSSSMDSLTKFSYNIGFKYSNYTGAFSTKEYNVDSFFGPSQPGQTAGNIPLPVYFTQPYMDCGKSNQWIISSVSPVMDYMYRFVNWTHIRRPRIVALSVMDMYFKQIDFNACPVSTGNPGPSYLSGIARCKTKTTVCKHVPAMGFKRGGYSCPCRPGYRYPVSMKPPWRGIDIEKATNKEYETGFSCTKTDFRSVLPSNRDLQKVNSEELAATLSITTWEKAKRSVSNFIYKKFSRFYNIYSNETHINLSPFQSEKSLFSLDSEKVLQFAADSRKKVKERRRFHTRFRRSLIDEKSIYRIQKLFKKISSITSDNCQNVAPENLLLPGDVGYGVSTQFEFQARTALRLAHFLSNYLQNANPNENFGYHKGGARLIPQQIFGEVVANVMADFRIMSSGVFFDKYVFKESETTVKELFGPFAFRQRGLYRAVDSAGLQNPYTEEDWFIKSKQRWKLNTFGLKTYKMRAHVRTDFNGSSNIPFEYYPMRYKAPMLKDGFWTRPYFRCDGLVNKWIVTYAVPFFGIDELRTTVIFNGVVTVDIPLKLLRINQCPQPFYVANAFKNTARCPETTTCAPLAHLSFTIGSYRCNCKQGTEYPINDGKFWIEGSLLELEYIRKKRGLINR